VSNFQRQARLSDTSRTGQGEQPTVWNVELLQDAGNLMFSSDQRSQWNGQVAFRLFDGGGGIGRGEGWQLIQVGDTLGLAGDFQEQVTLVRRDIQMLGQQLTGRGGFQHNPAFDTENNRYYASHCTCTTKLHGPDAPPIPYMLRRFMHTNEGSCAIQVFWKEGDPVTMLHYYSGKEPQLDVYAGRVFKSYPAPPAAGCTTNVAIELTDRTDAGMVKGHHNILYCGDFARKFRLFANLYKIKLVESGATPRPA
jgi:hypothetical protein